jgi:hypothetical protein
MGELYLAAEPGWTRVFPLSAGNVATVARRDIGHMYLRADSARNGQAGRIRWAHDYLLPA